MPLTPQRPRPCPDRQNWGMRFLLPAVVLLFGTAQASEIWLDCGGREIMLDSAKETFSIQTADSVLRGTAQFFPRQINFEVVSYDGSARHEKHEKVTWAINRQDLSYETRLFTGHSLFRGQITWSTGVDSKLTGTCELIPDPTKGNKI